MAKPTKKKASAPSTQLQSSAPKSKDRSKTKSSKPEKPVAVKAPPVLEPSDDEGDEEDEEVVNYVDANEGGNDSDEDEGEDNEDEGVDEEGMERLMKLLGEDGLDDFDRAQLDGLVGGDEDEGDSEDGSEDGVDEEVSDEEGDDSISDEEDENLESGDREEDYDTIPLDEVDEIDEDAVPQQKLEIDNQVALERIRSTIQLDPSLPWTETLSVTYPQKIEVDVDDDLNRELAFYKQALHGAQSARALATKHNFPFTRPSDYFAEMIKSDAHMERIRQRLLNESATIKKSEDKRKEREGKKFGKQVQIEKIKERQKSKKDMDERLKNLKRKRKDILDKTHGGEDDFDVAVEDAISDRPSKRGKPSESSSNNKNSRMPRNARDKKYGFGGAGRRSKQNTKDSTDNFGPSAGRGNKGAGGKGGRKQQQRPGKSRRMAARSKS